MSTTQSDYQMSAANYQAYIGLPKHHQPVDFDKLAPVQVERVYPDGEVTKFIIYTQGRNMAERICLRWTQHSDLRERIRVDRKRSAYRVAQ